MPKQTHGLVYVAVGPTGKKYVGKTQDTCMHRWNAHVNEAVSNARPGCRALNRAIRKYGAATFMVTVIESGIAALDLNSREVYHIAEQKSFGKGGYNLTSGGDTPSEISPSTLKLMGANKRAQWKDPETRGNLQKCHSAEAIQKTVDLWKGRRVRKAECMTKQEAERLDMRYEKSQKKRLRDLGKRVAMRNPEHAAAWHEKNGRMTTDDRKREEMYKQRMQRVVNMDYLDGQSYLSRAKLNAIGTAKSKGASIEHIERWYPNVLTGAEITALRKNGGVWPDSVPGLQAS